MSENNKSRFSCSQKEVIIHRQCYLCLFLKFTVLLVTGYTFFEDVNRVLNDIKVQTGNLS